MGFRAGAWAAVALTLGLALTAGADEGADPRALSGSAGGTVFRDGADAFSAPLPALDGEGLRRFNAGRRLFRTVWRPQGGDGDDVGLGPLFNRNACAGCHVRDGRGRPPASDGPARGMLARLSPADAGFGAQLQDQALVGIANEGRLLVRYLERAGRFDDGGAYRLRVPEYRISGPAEGHALSARVPPAVHGAGLLAAVDERSLRALADADDADGDGVSGRLAEVARGGAVVIGRFGWKASRASLAAQVADAAAEDIGLASSTRPDGGCAPAQIESIPACRQEVELGQHQIAALVDYLRGLAVPARRNLESAQVARGEAVFAAAGCPACHAPELVLGADAPAPGLAGAAIRPYTDLLLHDMGEGLADPTPEGAARASEWRTPPLWGIGLVETVNGHGFFLHDGRARSLLEAVLWHGGEAAAARDAVLALPAADRAALIAFLQSL